MADPYSDVDPVELKLLREHAGLSQEELGVLLGVSGVSVAHYETGKRKPRISYVDRLRNTCIRTIRHLLQEPKP
jgi:transcriptional regulator with XRE-family HTH domain